MFCRIRPRGRTGDPSAGCLQAGEDGELAVHDPAGKQDMRLYKFDRIFGEGSTQAEVYEDTQALIRSVLDGALRTSWGSRAEIRLMDKGSRHG